ncbi:glycosyltransferase family A protein [Microbulbifer thermotolerans]|uniref:Glycosyltransferase 2-like domain-containing protein n=1 Tax=Microbulbifer thermotolerans TaxID=252514 RepID=A0A143HLU7_MICTH|nr:glycosyltransferase family A protein [Microbulbifer thermotolerans]AMX02668.1 hypothetical protein A3224_08785 [Microbulbifer thermotolerans]
MGSASEVAVVIPVHNERKRIIEAICSIVDHNDASVKFYIADDNSNDNTVEAATDFLTKKSIPFDIFFDNKKRGAGYRRNQAFEHVIEPYTLFFDADDFVYPGMLDEALKKAKHDDSEVLLMKYERVFALNDKKLGMIPEDQVIFERLNKQSANNTSCFSTIKHGYILKLTNYPWNKLIKTDFAKRIGLKFSETPVHNDVLGHWILLMNAERVSILPAAFCAHRVSITANQITNIFDERRLAMLDVFQDLEDYFSSHDNFKYSYYHFFVNFKLKLFYWAWQRLDDGLKDDFKSGFSESFKSMTKLDFIRLSEGMPATANKALRFRLGLS